MKGGTKTQRRCKNPLFVGAAGDFCECFRSPRRRECASEQACARRGQEQALVADVGMERIDSFRLRIRLRQRKKVGQIAVDFGRAWMLRLVDRRNNRQSLAGGGLYPDALRVRCYRTVSSEVISSKKC